MTIVPGEAVPALMELGPLDLATGVPLGLLAAAEPPAPQAPTARAALDAAVLDALQHPPCVVSFSGGRDSSAILALATSLARREGLPEPVPFTWRFPDLPATEESQWQEVVISHLSLSDWERRSFGEELELLGEVALPGLLEHGLLWPPNVHLHVPALEQARGGALLTGWDGDAVLDSWRFARAQAVLHGRARPKPRDALRIGLMLAPAGARRRIRPAAGWLAREFPWLTARARGEIAGSQLRSLPPRRFSAWVAWYARQRYLRIAVRSLDLLAAARSVAVQHPLASPAFLSALAREGRTVGIGATRAEVMRALFGDLLPEALLARRSKANLGRVWWGARSRAFASAWDGSGVDPDLVDRDRLRSAWASSSPPFGSATLLQAAWLAGHNRRIAPGV